MWIERIILALRMLARMLARMGGKPCRRTLGTAQETPCHVRHRLASQVVELTILTAFNTNKQPLAVGKGVGMGRFASSPLLAPLRRFS